jgi:hypothetical protein
MMDEIACCRKSWQWHIALISWGELENIKDRYHDKTGTQLTKLKIRMIFQCNPGRAGYSWAPPNRKAPINQNSKRQTGVNTIWKDSKSNWTSLHLQLAMRESWHEAKTPDEIGAEFGRYTRRGTMSQAVTTAPIVSLEVLFLGFAEFYFPRSICNLRKRAIFQRIEF